MSVLMKILSLKIFTQKETIIIAFAYKITLSFSVTQGLTMTTEQSIINKYAIIIDDNNCSFELIKINSGVVLSIGFKIFGKLRWSRNIGHFY